MSYRKQKILFECRSIYPGKSGGIENYLYMLVANWKIQFPDDEIYLHIPPSTRNEYSKILGNDINYLIDPLYHLAKKHFLNNLVLKYFVLGPAKFSSFFSKYFFGLRKSWINKMDKNVNVVIYPFQREQFVHDPSKTIFVMHDFREWDLPEGEKEIIKQQKKAINKAAKIVVSWPYPYKRLIELFPQSEDKSTQIPFLYDPFNKPEQSDEVSNFLYYPSGNGEHKNHEGLIAGLATYLTKYDRDIEIICTGPIIPERDVTLKNLLTEKGLQSKIKFLGFVDRKKVFELYENCLGVISTTKYEAFSGAVLEAFRYKKPVICSNIAPITEFLNYYELNLGTFDPDSPEQISEAINDLIVNRKKHKIWSEIGYEKLRLITPDLTVKKFKELAIEVQNDNKKIEKQNNQ